MPDVPVGSTYGTVKAAIVSKLGARPGLSDVTVLYRPPVQATDLRGENGSGKAMWLVDADGSFDNVVFGAPGLWIEESYSLLLVIQALPVNGDGQEATDLRVDQMLYEVLQETAGDPTWGLAGQFSHLRITRGEWQRFTGPYRTDDGTVRAEFPARCEFQLAVEARMRFEGD